MPLDTKTIEDLEKLIVDRDAESLKQLAAIDLKTKENSIRISDIEKHVAAEGSVVNRLRRENGSGGMSLGTQFVESDAFKAFANTPAPQRGKKGGADLLVKATLTSLTTDAAGSVGAGIQPHREPTIDMLPMRRRTIRDLVPVVQTGSSSVEVAVQKGRTNNAAPVAEGNTKPSSDVQLELKTFPVRLIAHWMKASRQVIEDIPQLRGMIDGELLYGLEQAEETELLYGDNTGQHLYGMVPQATAFAAPIVLDPVVTQIDIIGLAMLQAALAEYAADGVIMHPSDWLQIRLLKDETGKYLYGPPGQVVEPRIFGQPVVATQAMTSGKFLVGEFQRAAKIYDRWEARVEAEFVNDDFVKNLITILAEERLTLTVTRPAALIYGDMATALNA